MSVVAWDGQIIACDRQGTNSNLRHKVSKSIRCFDERTLLFWTGTHEQGLMLAQWYVDGAKPDKWPEFQKDKEDWTRLIVAGKEQIETYEHLPIAQIIMDDIMAWGCGRDYALGAMAAGADAVKAVEIASLYDPACGLGVEAYIRHNGKWTFFAPGFMRVDRPNGGDEPKPLD
jgi:hypothetical protein